LQSTGEADECGCAQCRGVELPAWLSRLQQPLRQSLEETAVELTARQRMRGWAGEVAEGERLP
jgi:hypothetical protein